MSEFFWGQGLALLTFFGFPAIQYLLLKQFASREGRPELWFLPRWGFRLVIHNISGTKKLSDIRYRALLRRRIPGGEGASAATFDDRMLLEREDFFLFPGTDQVLVSFRVERAATGLEFVLTDKLGVEAGRFELGPEDRLIVDYTANIENFFNFDIRLAKRAILKAASLQELAEPGDKERQFQLDAVREVG